MVHADSHKVSRAPCYLGALIFSFYLFIQDSHLLWFTFPNNSISFYTKMGNLQSALSKSHYPDINNSCKILRLYGLGSFRFARRYSGNRYLLYFPRLTKMIQFGRFPMLHVLQTCGLPYSDILRSTLACSSLRLFAAYHVLLRLLLPRHSLYALNFIS